MGADPIGLPVFERLAQLHAAGDIRLAGVISQPARPSGRGRKLQANAIAAAALAHKLDLLRPEKPDDATVTWLQQVEVDVILVMAYGHILKKNLLAVARKEIVNLHASILPKLRGASPVETAVATGENQTGVSLMRIVPKMDAGAVCDIERVWITDSDTGGSVREKLAACAVPLVERNLADLLAGAARFQPQVEAEATYCRKLTREDGALDYGHGAQALACRVRGLDPWPGCFIEVETDRRIKVRGARFLAQNEAEPGVVLGLREECLAVGTAAGTLLIEHLQRPGGKLLPAPDFLRGFPIPAGTRLLKRVAPPLIEAR
ncbi:MAG: methionyl-tRNA formyltransferase [Opitutales bacterium]